MQLKADRFEDIAADFGDDESELAVDAELNEKANFDEKGELYCCYSASVWFSPLDS